MPATKKKRASITVDVDAVVKPRREGEVTAPERRVFDLQDCRIELRNLDGEGYLRDDNGQVPTFVGYAAVWDSLSVDLGGFREIVRDSAFDESLAAGADVRLLINHDSNYVLGRTRSGTCTLSKDDTGLRVECPLPDTTFARDLQVSMARGDVDQMSFGFRARQDSWKSTDAETSLPIRDLLRADLFDVSVVTFPAYPETSAECRDAAQQAMVRLELGRMQEFPLAPIDHPWDEAAAVARLRAHTGSEETLTNDFARCSFWHTDNEDLESFRLFYCDVVDDEIRAVPVALALAARDLDNAGLPDEAAETIRGTLTEWYARMAAEFDNDKIVAPWDKQRSVSAEVAAGFAESIAQMKASLEGREGKVLSKTSRDTITSAVQNMSDAMESLQALLEATQEADPILASYEDGETRDDDEEPEAVVRFGRPNFIAFRKAILAEGRDWDYDDDWEVYLLTQAISLISSFMVCEEDEPHVAAAEQVVTGLSALLSAELAEASLPDGGDGMRDAEAEVEQVVDVSAARTRRLQLLQRESALELEQHPVAG